MSEQQLDENKLIAERRAKLSAIRENCRANGFPNGFRRENYAEELQGQFGELDKETLEAQDNQVSIAGHVHIQIPLTGFVQCTGHADDVTNIQ